ncbi:peptidase C14 caspase catalytic subunit p20 [Streptomyces sp. NPDC093225]|uniref:peptidase C14 caspase catalytic subunit p20 n=1 Tax=Streptomyces sp. NPDC093225 TaxID=3366034 RepID=UPI003801E45C
MVDQLTMIRSERRATALVGTVAVARYAHPGGARTVLPDLRNVADVRDRFTDTARTRLEFGESLRVDAEGATRRRLWDGLESFLAHDAERKILYWTGHGVELPGRGYFLACEDSCATGAFDPDRAVALTDLVDRLLQPDCESDTLLVVDACYAHGHLPAALDRALDRERESVRWARRNRRAGFVVVGTSGIDATVPDGRWVDWLDETLAAADFVAADHARPFDPAALYLPVPYLLEGIDAAAAAAGLDEPAQRPGHVEVRSLPNSFLDNPYFTETRRLVHTTAVRRDHAPWFGTERFGLEDDGHLRRHFAGRQGALSRVVRWMDTHPRGLLALTGPAGTGKTALLGRLALTSLTEWRDALRSAGPDPARAPGGSAGTGAGVPSGTRDALPGRAGAGSPAGTPDAPPTGTGAEPTDDAGTPGPAELVPATLPRAGTVHAALSCRGRSLHSLTTALWHVLSRLDGMDPVPGPAATPARLCDAVDRLVRRAGSLNLLVDALDEALPEQAHEIARHLLNPLSALWGVRVVVGTRPQPRRRTTGHALEESLLDTLDQTVAPVVLGDDEEAGRSIAAMVASVLAAPGSPYRDAPGPARGERYAADGGPYAAPRPDAHDLGPAHGGAHDGTRGHGHAEERAWISRLVAAESHGSFLVARLTARELARRPRAVTETELAHWMRSGAMGLAERLAEEVGHLAAQPGAGRAEEVLRPLAVVQGRGLARRGPWLALANALRDPGTPELTAGDLRRTALGAAGGIVTTQPAPDTQDTAYHLAHPSYGALFLQRAGLDAQQAHRTVVAALRARAADGWAHADAYTLDHLGAHAAQAGRAELRALFDDPGFLLRTDPDVMLPLAAVLARESDGAALYGRVGDAFRGTPDLLARAALLRAAAFVSHRAGAYAALERTLGALPWQEYWTDLPPDPLEWRRPAPLGGARTLSWGAGPGAADQLSGDTLAAGGRGEVLVLHPASGRRLLTRRTHGADQGRGEALTEVREVGSGAHRTTVARDDRALYFWRSGARLPEYVYRWGGAVWTLAAAERGTETVVLAADGRHVWVWRWRRGGTHWGDESLADITPSDTERLAALTLGRRLFVLTAGRRAALREVDRDGGRGRRGAAEPLGEERDLGELAAPALAAAAVADPSPAAPAPAGPSAGSAPSGACAVPAPSGSATSVPPGPSAGTATPVTRSGWLAVADGTRVRLWRCRTDDGAPTAPPDLHEVRSFDSPAHGLAFGRYGDRLLLAVHERLTVRVLDLSDPEREARFRIDAPRDEAMAFEPRGQGVLAVADGPDIRMLEVGSALSSGHGMPRRAHDQRPQVALAAAPEGPPLLCRVWGERILLSRPDRAAPATGPAEVLGHAAPVTAVRAVRCGDGWAVAAAARRTVRLWLLAADLTVRARHDLELGGDPGDRVPSLGLAVDPAAGRLHVYAPDRQRIEHAELTLGTGRTLRRGEPVPAGLRSCALDARVMHDGTSLLAADLGDELLLWEHRDGRLVNGPRVPLPGRGADDAATRVALGELYDADDEESFPLLAWVDGGVVKIAEFAFGSEKRQTLRGAVRGVTALVFAGPPERPLLLVCDERRAPGVWDVRAQTWLHGDGVPPRGYAVRAADAAADGEGLVVALQGDHRCDLIRLPHAPAGTPADTP